MKILIIDMVRRAINPRDKNFRNHLSIFLICCIISLFIWLLIKMSDEYVAEIDLPVKYENLPSNKLLAKADDHISVWVRAKGGSIFSAKFLSRQGNVPLNLRHAEIKKSRYYDRYYLLTGKLTEIITQRFDFAHSIVAISPDTLFLNFEEIVSKSVPVKAMIDVSCKPQYQVYDSILIKPEIITIRGPASAIDTLKYIRSVSSTFKDLDRTTETTIALELPYKDDRISYSAKNVNIIIPIEKFTESTIELPIAGHSKDPESRVRTFPETLQLTYQVAIKDFTKVKPDMFLVTAFYDPVNDKDKRLIKVNIDRSPDFIRITRIQPEKVEFLIQK